MRYGGKGSGAGFQRFITADEEGIAKRAQEKVECFPPCLLRCPLRVYYGGLLLPTLKRNVPQPFGSGSFYKFKINPLGRNPVLLVGERVRDDDLQDVFAGRQFRAEFQTPRGLDSFEAGLLTGV